ncbi:MAG: 16S rRNA (adenine(1518)-N(6)/adenine(1519)-N(6))-dimethyltransferase RsmA [Endomicrobium sp.]|nr:16S rRNA (adenine(1518)-N(6)/adenine(1519)-N(6))-dimethyltransferase RsmA [Endomicrobium sp.]
MYGQNFLIDNNIAHNIVKAANLTKDDNVLEIGPGKGILTKIILPLVDYLICIEIDTKLCKQLEYFFASCAIKNVKIVNYDFLKYCIPDNKKFKIIANLPYNIGTAIIQKILPISNWNTAIFMLQKETVLKLTANPDDKNYGYISIFTLYYSDCTILFNVSAKCFNPSPKSTITSSVIKLTNKFSKPPDPLFFYFIKHVFSTRRKTILNSICSFKGLQKQQVRKILDNLKVDSFLRPNQLSISDFLKLTEEIKKYIIPQI